MRYFVAVAEELSFTRAAERLFISQPALSKQIRQLEELMRVRLFDRDRRTVRLTAPGEALLPAARRLLQQWDEAQQAVDAAVAAVASRLTVGMSTSVGRGLLGTLRERFTERQPGCDLRLRQVNWTDPTAGLAEGEVDVAFVWLPFPGQDDLNIRVVAREPRWVAFRHDHWLAGRDEVAFAELLEENFLALPESAGPLRDHWLATDERGGRSPVVCTTVTNAEETFAALESGDTIVLLAAGNAEIYRRPGIMTIPVTGLSPSVLALAWRPGDHRSTIRDLVEALSPEP
ncbi:MULTISPECIES: LysR family transcriptional regulator [Streptosporangium]|uniref:DNA-binding transcriptional LysR family regulator n=1 Tax=Streptosporangium brasiliense TaxID=47480 RepID=A0ABT9R8C6_9ACTN|nr:LysR family transcriptional regulator [Streptosporangium brasiliense]MDP9865403.1 DNA-binding transcriptional LysR family regulator [Streptosporangium brasiliense]